MEEDNKQMIDDQDTCECLSTSFQMYIMTLTHIKWQLYQLTIRLTNEIS